MGSERHLPLSKPITAAEAARKLSAAAFRLWILLHFETDLDAGRSVLARKHGTSKATFDRALLELRRNAYMAVETAGGSAACSIRFLRVLDATGRNAVKKYVSLTGA